MMRAPFQSDRNPLIMPDLRTIFADGILDASVTHGVARLTLAQTGGEGKPVAAGQLVMPLSQLPTFANGIITLLKQIEAKMKEAQAQGSGGGGGGSDAQATGAAAESSSVPGAFRFG
jgi:hypothetical protein